MVLKLNSKKKVNNKKQEIIKIFYSDIRRLNLNYSEISRFQLKKTNQP